MALAKTTRPRQRGVFARKRLFRLLDHRMGQPISWVQGPPGSGKTTLVSSYIAERKISCLWYHVDEGDRDVASFFYHLGLAAPPRRRSLPLLTPEYLPELTVFTQRFFRELYSRLSPPFVIVFDDYHDVPGDSELHGVVRTAFSEIPRDGQAIVVSRFGPPPALARLRANRAIRPLDGAELRLTLEEARGLVRSVTGKSLSAETVRDLHRTVDGWAAGLVLLLEREREDHKAITRSFKRNPQEVFDYFAGEIFARSDRETQEVLLQTAYFPRFTARMANQLTGLSRAGDVVEGLAREHYFTARHGRDEPSYRYHDLFREYLQTRANRTYPAERRRQILSSAAKILTGAKQFEGAVELYREAEDWEGLAKLIEATAPALVQQGRFKTLEEWIRSLPGEMINERPWLLFWRGSSRMPFDLAGARPDLESAFHRFRKQKDATGTYLAYSAILRSHVHAYHEFSALDKWIDSFELLKTEFPEFPSIDVEANFTGSVIFAILVRQPYHPALPALIDHAERLVLRLSQSKLPIEMLAIIACYYFWRGELNKGADIAFSLREKVHLKDITILEQLTALLFGGRFEWLLRSPAAAITTITEGLELAEGAGVSIFHNLLFIECAIAALTVADHATAEQYLEKVSLRLKRLSRCDLASYHYLSAWYAFLTGNVSAAYSHQEQSLKYAVELGIPLFEAIVRSLCASIVHRRGEDDLARQHVSWALAHARKGNACFVEFIALLAQAELAFDLGEEQKGLDSLRRAMAVGAEYGYVNTFTWRSELMARLCTKALEAGIEVDYVRKLISERGLVPETPPVEIEQWPWPIKVFTLGRFELLVNDQPVEFSGKVQRKPLELLKVLIASGGKSISEERLIEALWPDAEGDVANQSLSTTIHRLRRLLGDEAALQRQDRKLTLDPRICWADVWSLESLLSKAEAAAGKPAKTNGLAEVELLLDKARGLYRGPFLAGEQFSWATWLTDRLRRRLVRQFEKVGIHYEEALKWRSAIEIYDKAIEIDPCAEEIYRRQMTAYRSLGQRGEALAVYERCRNALTAHLQVEPSPATEALCRAIRD